MLVGSAKLAGDFFWNTRNWLAIFLEHVFSDFDPPQWPTVADLFFLIFFLIFF